MYLFLLWSVLQDAGPAGISFRDDDDPDPSVAGPAGGSEDQSLFTLLHWMHFLSKHFSMLKNSRHPSKISSFLCCHFRAFPPQSARIFQLYFGSTEMGICPTHFVNSCPMVMQTRQRVVSWTHALIPLRSQDVICQLFLLVTCVLLIS